MIRKKLGRLLRRWADQVDYHGAPRVIGWSFTFEIGEGIRFRKDGKGCRLWYLGRDDYEHAHADADNTADAAVKLTSRYQDGYWYPEGKRYPTLGDLVRSAVAQGLDPATVRVDHAGCDHCGVGVVLFEPSAAVAGSDAASRRQGHAIGHVWDEQRGVWPVTRMQAAGQAAKGADGV